MKEKKRTWEMSGAEFERYLKKNKITGLAAAFADTKRRRMMKNAAAKVTTLLLLASLFVARAGTVAVKFDVPDRYVYQTIDDAGTVELWEKRPKLFTTDSGVSCWWEDSCGPRRGIIMGGVPSKHWKHSLRRIRK
jgi:hypothetical protein